MFGTEGVKLLVECASRALENENRHLEKCFKKRHWKISENGPGICDNLNERYYQFVIWRELMSSFPWRSKTERQDYDLVFYDDATNSRVAVAEIKGWWSNSGKQELQAIKRDLKGKLEIAPVTGVMLILTSQLTKDAQGNFNWLTDKLGMHRDDILTSSFPVSPGLGTEGEWEFAIMGFLATQTLSVSA